MTAKTLSKVRQLLRVRYYSQLNSTIMYENIIVAIDTYSHGLRGRKYENNLDAIKDGGYSVFDDARIRRCFNFGNGSMDDFRRFVSHNKMKIIPTETFFSIVDSLPDSQSHYNYIKDTLRY